MLPALLLVPIVALYRILMAWQTPVGGSVWSWLPGFSPLSAVAFCAGAFLPRRLALAVPLGALLASDFVIDAHYGVNFWTPEMAGHYIMLAVAAGLGMALRAHSGRQVGVAATLGGTLLASTMFYVATNTFSWFGSRDYPQTAAGWAQALTTGLPGYLPSYYFFRNALVSDLLYSILLLVCVRLAEKRVFPASSALSAERVSRQPVSGSSFQ